MKHLRSESGSLLTLAVGLIAILMFATLAMLNLGYLVATRFQIQSQLDALSLQLVQQIDYDRYFQLGYSEELGFDLTAIDQGLVTAVSTGQLARCGSKIDAAISGLEITLGINCQVALPLPMPGLPSNVSLQIGSSARLAQAAG